MKGAVGSRIQTPVSSSDPLPIATEAPDAYAHVVTSATNATISAGASRKLFTLVVANVDIASHYLIVYYGPNTSSPQFAIISVQAGSTVVANFNGLPVPDGVTIETDGGTLAITAVYKA
jgi:hypothetical protein